MFPFPLPCPFDILREIGLGKQADTACPVKNQAVHLPFGQHHEPLHRQAQRPAQQAGWEVCPVVLRRPTHSPRPHTLLPLTLVFSPLQDEAKVAVRPGVG